MFKKIIILTLLFNVIQSKVYDGCTDFMNECICPNTGNKGRCLPSTGCYPDADNQTCCNCNNDVLSDQEIEKLQEVAFNKFYRKYPSLLQPIKDALDNKKISYWDLPNIALWPSHGQVWESKYLLPENNPPINYFILPFTPQELDNVGIRDWTSWPSWRNIGWWRLKPEAFQIKTRLLDKTIVMQELFPTDDACKGKIVNQFCACGNTGMEGYCWISRQPMPDQPSLAMYCHCD